MQKHGFVCSLIVVALETEDLIRLKDLEKQIVLGALDVSTAHGSTTCAVPSSDPQLLLISVSIHTLSNFAASSQLINQHDIL